MSFIIGGLSSGRSGSPESALALETRRQTAIPNTLDRSPVSAGSEIEAADLRKKYWGARHRPTHPCNTYNCHGLTFASRRTAIWDPESVVRILKEDDYVRIRKEEVMPGDIVVYYINGYPDHSGIVMETTDVGVRILSKWGKAHEVVHMIGECPYDANQIEFYRVMK